MKISSKLRKIISFMLVAVLAMSAVVLPVSAAESTTEEVEKPEVQFDFSRGYYTDPAELKYTGEHSDNLTSKFNVRQEYDMSFTMNDYYYSAPFCFYVGDGTDPVLMFTGDNQKYGEGFSYSYLQSATATFFKDNELSLSDYDIYYYGVVGRSSGEGIFSLNYFLVPHGKRVAFCNSSYKNEFDNGASVWGFYAKGSSFASRNGNDKNNSIVHVRRYMNASYGQIQDSCNWAEYSSNCIYDGASYYPINCDKGFYGTQYACMNIPVFNTIADAGLYVNEIRDPAPDNKAPVEEPEPEEKVGADAFYWDSLKCRISQQGQAYNFVYDYSYSVPDMVAHPEEYTVYTDYSQVVNYRFKSQLSYDNFTTEKHSSFNLSISTKTAMDTVTLNEVSQKNSLGTAFFIMLDTVAAQKYVDTNFSESEILGAYIYVTVTLVHTIDGGNGLSVKDKVSSDVRTFKFDATTLESLDSPEEIKSDVKIDDTKNENGKVIDRTVSQVVTNDNSTHQTINNYYYDSDGNRKGSSGSSIGDSLSDIASGLINFIKTLVTEGLPAALEVLKTLIKSISDLIGFAVDQIGDIGQGASNGLIAVLKAIPVPLWGICSVGLIVFVVAGVLKKIF